MLIFPAIDLMAGRCVRLTHGVFGREQPYSDDPAKIARDFEASGAEWLHVVDLDGAKSGSPQNLAALKDILGAVSFPVQFGGGVRSAETAGMVLEFGVVRVVLGTSLISDQGLARRLFSRLGPSVAAGIDALNRKARISGWEQGAAVDAVQLAKRAEMLGAKRLIVTDIARDGCLAGPGIDLIRSVSAEVEIPVIASGGVSSIADIEMLKRLGVPSVEGVIIGKALYEKRINLEEALVAAR